LKRRKERNGYLKTSNSEIINGRGRDERSRKCPIADRYNKPRG
jgi:hypothetical protein